MLDAAAGAMVLYKGISAPVKAAMAFESKLEDIGQKINAPIKSLPQLGQEIRKVARDTTQSASAMAEGMDILAGMGAGRDDALALLNPIGKAATAYKADVADLAQAGYAALDNLKVPALEFGRALDVMAVAGKEGAFELRDMSRYFPQLGAGYQALKQTGVPAVADLSAALQIVRKGTGDSASAATNLSNILQKINAPLTRKNFAKMGVDLEKEMAKAAKKGMTPIEAIAEITNRTLKGDLGRLGDLFNDAQVQQGLRPLIQNIEEYRRIRAAAMAAQGVVEEDYQRRLLTGEMAAKRFSIAVENINNAVGAALLPALSDLAGALVPIVNRMADWAEANPALTRGLVTAMSALVGFKVAAIAANYAGLFIKGAFLDAGIAALSAARSLGSIAIAPVVAGFNALRTAMIGYAAAAAVGGHGAALSAMGGSLLSLLNPLRLVTAAFQALKFAVIGTGIGAIVVGIAMAGAWIYNNWSGISTAFEAFKGAFSRAIEPVMPTLQPVLDGFSWLWEKVSSLLGPIDEMGGGWTRAGLAAGTFVGDTLKAIIELPGKVAAFAGDMLKSGMTLAQSMWDGIKAKIDEMLAWFKGLPGRIISAIGSIDIGSLIKWPSPPAWLSRMWGGGDTVRVDGPTVDGARASGGPVRAGGSYLVGERGAEIFRPRQSGTIVPNHAIGGGGVTNYNTFNINGANMDLNAVVSAVVERLSRATRSSVQSQFMGAY
ncbi:phage tail tape measure protein [Mesorhizobium sp. PUT5]|uniref:phage tail tape measure protein n=1 Tax=Mesorhizobium sp. PUT5 TaxID=3454629 RepID=UPI003FA44D7C